jgi:hypothetical protein
MRTHKMGWSVFLMIAMLGMVTFTVTAQSNSLPPSAPVAGKINYQGRLTNSNGTPQNGTFPMRFQVYNDPTSGSLLWDSGEINITVQNGLFNAGLNIDQGDFNGQGLWLRIYVDEEWLTPRQELLPVPYALSLIPGAEISGSYASGSVLKVANIANPSSGSALWGSSVSGIGIVGSSDNDIGVYGTTNGGANSDYGVYGQGSGLSYGVHGYNASSETGGLGVFGKNAGGGSGVSGLNQGSGNGTWGYSESYNGVGGATNRLDNNYGLYTPDNLHSNNFHLSGATMRVVQNGDDEFLEPGDVVVISGMGSSPGEDLPPVIQVSKAKEAGSTAVLGVVAASYAKEWFTAQSGDPTGASNLNQEIPLSEPRPIAPGEFLLVVIEGPCNVKVNLDGGMMQIGDLLSTAEQPGYARKAVQLEFDGVTITAPGTIFGKALEPLGNDQDLIYVYVGLR